MPDLSRQATRHDVTAGIRSHQRRAARAVAAQPWCTVCGHPGSTENPLTADHVVPLSRGGERGPLRVACRR